MGEVLFHLRLAAENVVVVLGESVALIADVLEQAQAGVVAGEVEGLGAGLDSTRPFTPDSNATLC